ncbi:MAG: hypothetical protein ABI878_13045 [Acidobacteriota bacterium]
MPGGSRAEIYFITAMMILIFVVCGVAIYFFFVTYKKEMREKEERLAKKRADAERDPD